MRVTAGWTLAPSDGEQRVKLSNGERQVLRIFVLCVTLLAAFQVVAQLSDAIARLSTPLLIFILAWMIAFLLAPLVSRIDEGTRLNRVGAVVVVYVAIALLLAGVVIFGAPALARQLAQLAADATGYASGTTVLIRDLQTAIDGLGLPLNIVQLYGSLPATLGELTQSAATGALGLVQATVTLVFDLTLVLIIAFLILVDGSQLWQTITGPLSKEVTSEAELLRQAVERSFGGYIRGTILLAAVYGGATALVLTVLDVPYSGLLAVLSGLAMLVPFFGPPAALVPVALAAALGTRVHPLIVVGLILLLQQVVLNVLGPRVLSSNVGIHPLFVFGALIVGAQIAGFWGALFGVPVAGILATLVRYLVELIQGRRERGKADEMLVDEQVEAAAAETPAAS
jgi:predicted PurR-regulated permease PerM